ncbi:hypothetical protein [Fodinicola acaciae]|uniref:hypothetical protein n=1 Tax=Fodinicola acaciae TaxID=2681555 RepID=UPI0013D2E2FC|nr:hypothetical protein [Fodinicola acaciae]
MPTRQAREVEPEPVRPRFRIPPAVGRWLWILLAVPAAYGLWLRVDGWWNARVLSADEESIAWSAIGGGVRGWIEHGPDLLQSAPLGWLYLQRLLLQISGGVNERLMHAPELVADLAGLALLGVLAYRLFGLAGTFTVVALGATNQFLIYYSYNVKQYAFEALFTVLLVGTAMVVRQAEDRRAVLGWWGLAAISLAFSQAAVFAIPAIAAVLVLELVLRSQWRRLAEFAVTSVLFWAALALDYVLSLRHSAANSYLRTYWLDLGAFPPKTGMSTQWWSNLFSHFATNPIDAAVPIAVLLAAALGVARLLWRRPFDGLLVLAPLGAGVLATVLGIYPLWERAALWTVPLVLLLFGAAVGGARTDADSPDFDEPEVAGPPTRLLLGLVAAILLLSAVGYNVLTVPANLAKRAAVIPDLHPLLDGVKARLQPGDVVLVDSWAYGWTRLYWRTPDSPKVRAVVYLRPPDETCVAHPVEPLLSGAKRVWLLVINNHDYRPYADAGLPASLKPYGRVERALPAGPQTGAYLLYPGPSTGTATGLPSRRSCLAQLPPPVPNPPPG